MTKSVAAEEKGTAIIVQAHELRDALYSARVSLRGIVGDELTGLELCENDGDAVKSLSQLEELDRILREAAHNAQIVGEQVSRISNTL